MRCVIFEDGLNAKRWAEDYRSKTLEVTNETKLNISLAPGGGYTARLSKM
ncbi:MAG: glycoside hydrolase family 97 C-terminal domain-containing protein [Pseudomonadota bacterium]|nr:glycoside hydrolase family 97 C-terminal domain-containing protein [Pseudomonadota bacterium]